uniref:Centrosomal protein of 162 kDa n=1 Tax=Amazona collaria TaxID=241587 RepID=A0A8B9FC75_9PSIT
MSESPKLNSDKVSSTELERELQNLKKAHQITVKNLQTEIENLKSQNSQLKLRSKKGNEDLEYTDSQMKQVLQENAQLKEELERLSLEMDQQRVKSQATLAYSENNVRRIQEDTAEYIACLKASHQREVEKILCQHAKEHSTSKVAELSSKISTQEILIKHLQEQIGEQQRHQEALLVSQMREELLQKEVYLNLDWEYPILIRVFTFIFVKTQIMYSKISFRNSIFVSYFYINYT